MKVTIFSCHHQAPNTAIRTELFATLVSGAPPATDDRYITDQSGVNIADKPHYGELRHQFFVWKNLLPQLDFVGFEQYRRAFFIDPLAPELLDRSYPELLPVRRSLLSDLVTWRADVDSAIFQKYLSMRDNFDGETIHRIKRWIGSFDVVTTRPVHNEPIDNQWSRHHSPEAWPIFLRTLRQCRLFDVRRCWFNEHLLSKSYLNMYILRSELFDEYMKLWRELFDALEQKIPEPPTRLWAFLSERLFCLFLNQKRMENPLIRVCELPHLFVEQMRIA